MKIEDIKPIGNFEELLKSLRDKIDETIAMCHEKKAYNSAIVNQIKFIAGDLGLPSVLEDGIRKNKGWSIEEMIIDLLYTHLLIIDLNDVAQLYLNNIKMISRKNQLQEIIDDNKDIFGDLIIE